MKRISIALFIILLTIVITDCKKKYPKDIPRWLKEKIDQMEKDSKGNGCRNDFCKTVDEYSDGSSTFYWISRGSNLPTIYDIYNYEGIVVCIASYDPPCGNIGFKKYFIRNIWQEN